MRLAWEHMPTHTPVSARFSSLYGTELSQLVMLLSQMSPVCLFHEGRTPPLPRYCVFKWSESLAHLTCMELVWIDLTCMAEGELLWIDLTRMAEGDLLLD